MATCKHCEAPFVAPRRNPTRRYCSPTCRYAASGVRITATLLAKGSHLYTTSSGYRIVRVPRGHVSASEGGRRRRRFRAPEHILVAESALGRPLRRGEVVHHINCDSGDNRPENLLVCTRAYHAWLHGEMSRRWAREKFGRVA